jgi:hypothetical protein
LKANNWAIVIGIDNYTGWPAGGLHGAVRDAEAMREWLIDRSGGDVDKNHLFTLLSAHPASPAGAGPNEIGESTKDALTDLISALAARVNAGADRFFFYFAGHGLSNTGGPIGHDDAIAFSDFSPNHPERSLQTEHIFAKLGAMPFTEEFFFIDACRDTPWTGPKPIFGNFSTELQLEPDRPAPMQVQIFATTPGKRAAEVGLAGNERGAFTTVLLAGLRGQGPAKRYDPGLGQYRVLPTSLFGFVRERIRALKLSGGGANPSIQIPQMYCKIAELGNPDPSIVSVAPKSVAPVDLIVAVAPKEAPPPPPARVEIRRDEQVVAGGEWLGKPLQFTLPQRDYRVTTVSDVYLQEPDPVLVNLYDPAEALLSWRRKDRDSSPPAISGGGSGGGGPSGKATLTVRSSDRLAPLEIVAEGGKLIAQGLGEVVSRALKPGFYTARLRMPDRRPVEQPVSLNADDVTELQLGGPRLKGRVLDEIIASKIALKVGDEAVEVSKIVGPIAAPQVGTVLGLAAIVGDFPNDAAARDTRLARLGFGKSAWDQNLDVIVTLAEGHESPRGVSIQVSPIDDPTKRTAVLAEPLALPATTRGRIELTPRMYWLAIQLPQLARLVVPVAIFEGEITRVVVEVPADGGATLVMYNSRLGLDQARLRLVDLFERAVIADHVDGALKMAERLRRDGWSDPVARAIEGAVRLRFGQVAKVGSIAEGLVASWPLLSDGWALLGLAGVLPMEVAATQSLDAGIPVVSDTARALSRRVQALNLPHPGRQLLARVVTATYPGSFWTAWEG